MIKSENYFKLREMHQKINGLWYKFIEIDILSEVKEEILNK